MKKRFDATQQSLESFIENLEAEDVEVLMDFLTEMEEMDDVFREAGAHIDPVVQSLGLMLK